jgi:hypothetical protein
MPRYRRIKTDGERFSALTICRELRRMNAWARRFAPLPTLHSLYWKQTISKGTLKQQS